MLQHLTSALVRIFISACLALLLIKSNLSGFKYQQERVNVSIGMMVDEDEEDLIRSSRYAEHLLNLKLDRVRVDLKIRRFQMKNMFLVGNNVCDLLAEGPLAIVVGHSPWGQTTLGSFCATFHLPFVTITPPLKSMVTSSSTSSAKTSSSTNQNGDYDGPYYDSLPPTFDPGHSRDFYYSPQTEVPTDYGLYIHPYMVPAVFDLVRHYHWSEALYVFDDDDGIIFFHELSTLIKSRHGDKLRLKLQRATDDEDVDKLQERVDRMQSSGRNFILNLSLRLCEKIIRSQSNSQRGAKHSYVLVNLGITELDQGLLSSASTKVSGFSIFDQNDKKTRTLLNGWRSCKYSRDDDDDDDDGGDDDRRNATSHITMTHKMVLTIESLNFISTFVDYLLQKFEPPKPGSVPNAQHMSSAGQLPAKLAKMVNHSKPILCDVDPPQIHLHGADLLRAMKQVSIEGLVVGRLNFDIDGVRKSYELDVNEICHTRGLTKIGVWDPEKGLSILSPTIVRYKPEVFPLNKTRTITSIMSAPFLMLRPGSSRRTQLEGYCADLTKNVAEIVNFDYVIKPVNDSKYGSNSSGTWDGMVGELLRGEADMAIAPLTITADRESVIDFSKPFMSLGISIMIKRPSKEPPSVFSFMNPLSYEVWMCVIFAYIGVSVVLFLVSRFSPFEWHVEENQEGMAVTNNFTIFNSLWFSLGAFMQQGVDIEPRSMSGRIVGSVWWFFTLILISSYTANLAAFLTSERMQSPIESAEDLAKQTEIKYGTVDGGSTQEFFKKSTMPTYERMWAFMSSSDPQVFVKSTDEGVSMVREKNGKYAFLTESTQNEYTNQRKPCDTMKVGGNLDAKGYGIGTPMGSDLRDRVTLAVLELIEKGELANLEKKWWYEKGECSRDGVPKKFEATSALKLSNVAGVFYILVGGLILSLTLASVEYLCACRKFRRRSRTLRRRELSSMEVFQQMSTGSSETL